MKQLVNDYIAKAKKLSKEQRERVLSRMGGKLPKHLKNKKLTEEKAIAFQLEMEDEQLQEWRDKMAKIRAKELKEKLKAEAKAAKSRTAATKKPATTSPKKAASTTKAPAKIVAAKTPVKN